MGISNGAFFIFLLIPMVFSVFICGKHLYNQRENFI